MDFNSIIPDIIDIAPKTIIKITYPSGVTVDLGNELTPTNVKDQPEVSWSAEANAFYTLLMIDPDAPSRQSPTLGDVFHWLVINIPGNQVAQGQTVCEFIGSGAPKDTGLHRYVFLVFKQTDKIVTDKYVSKT